MRNILLLALIFTSQLSHTQDISVKYDVDRDISYFIDKKGHRLGKQDLAKIYRLDLSNQGIWVLPEEILDCDKLRSLNLSNNQLSELPEELWDLHLLRHLDLSFNQFKEFPGEEDWWRFRDFKRLDLSHNQLKSLGNHLWNLYDLEELDLSYNQLDSIPGEIFKLLELKKLNISHNRLPKILPYLRELPSLEELDISGNPLNQELSTEDQKMTFAYLAKTEPYPVDSNMINLSEVKRKLRIKVGQKLYFQDNQSGSKLDYVLINVVNQHILEITGSHKAYSKPQIHRPGYTGTSGGIETTIIEAVKEGKTIIVLKYIASSFSTKRKVKIIIKP